MRTLAGCVSGVEPAFTLNGISTSACFAKKAAAAGRSPRGAGAADSADGPASGSRGTCRDGDSRRHQASRKCGGDSRYASCHPWHRKADIVSATMLSSSESLHHSNRDGIGPSQRAA